MSHLVYLPACFLRASPPPVPSLLLVLFSASLIWLHRPCASTWRATGCLCIGMLLAKWILYRARLCLVWARNRNVLRNWQRGKDRAGWQSEKERLRRQWGWGVHLQDLIFPLRLCYANHCSFKGKHNPQHTYSITALPYLNTPNSAQDLWKILSHFFFSWARKTTRSQYIPWWIVE